MMRLQKIMDIKSIYVPFYISAVKAGFPSPADDYVEDMLDLNKLLIKHPAATYFVRASGDSMYPSICSGDILIVDRSIKPLNNDIVIASFSGELTVKRFKVDNDGIWLVPDNPEYNWIKVEDEMDFELIGVVTYVIKKT